MTPLSKNSESYMLSEEDIIEFLEVKIRTDYKWSIRAAQSLYRMTETKKHVQDTTGLNRYDVPRVKRILRLYSNNNLDPDYAVRCLSRILPKYVNQLKKISDMPSLIKQAHNYYMLSCSR